MKTRDEGLRQFFEWRRDSGFLIDPALPLEYSCFAALSHLIDKVRRGFSAQGAKTLRMLEASGDEKEFLVGQLVTAGYSPEEIDGYLCLDAGSSAALHSALMAKILS
ncbi:hypothetical protein HBO32_30115 [Pseudomonas nitroreducens]|uniref:hypothetical protein n=1 Tax=Pseudomonas nitroreducens TaxID=46680 RepID=UPI0014760E36|nr:hypothetical protein [Pseudomonas nitroreducens]NMZ77355.1 hypothetical protein [Pseudomonas nitroreducens]